MEAQEKSLMPILGQSASPRFYLWILKEKNFLFCHTQIKGPGNANLPTRRIFVILRKRVNTQKEVVHACSAVSNSFRPCGLSPIRLLHQWNFSGKNTGMGCHFLLQGILPTQGSSPCLMCPLHWQADSLQCTTWEAPVAD